MIEQPERPIPYRVSYSERVRNGVRNLIVVAKARRRGPEVLAAVKTIDERLHTYPQFGQALRDLMLGSAQLWIGVVPPLIVQYILDEENRAVFVVVPPYPSSRAGF